MRDNGGDGVPGLPAGSIEITPPPDASTGAKRGCG
jgi:hypothetical protein